MARDAVFRIASITKPIVAAASLMLLDECKAPDEPVDRLWPELCGVLLTQLAWESPVPPPVRDFRTCTQQATHE